MEENKPDQQHEKYPLASMTEYALEEMHQQTKDAPVLNVAMLKNFFSFSFAGALKDASFWMLLFSNAVAIFFILKNHVPVRDVMIIYWMQSVIIGFVNVARILSLKNFSTLNFKVNDRPVQPTNGTKIFTAVFFLVHYGFFHLAYLIFILDDSMSPSAGPIDWAGALAIASSFLVSHVFSLLMNFKQETEGKNIGSVMFAPYARILPMHLAIVIGAGSAGAAMGIFLFVKTAIDLLSHTFKHREKILEQ